MTDIAVKGMDKNIMNSPPNSEAGEEIGEPDVSENSEEIDPNHIEERFRVDRRKLEQMIQSNGREETAEDFFLRIMADTDTHITWPSKLKIGAKSKKDPHIKISGHKDNVADAKTKVMMVLDTKSTRVTLKMDVSYTEHSHVIGKGGNNIKHVMQQTGCHIHFPDSNRSNQTEKSNQVSIAGQPLGVEQARAKIRDLLPLVFMFELPMTGVLPSLLDASAPPIKALQDSYGVTVTFKQRPRVYMTTVIVRGTVCKAKSVKEATVLLIEQLTGNRANNAQVSLQLEIAPQHHLFIMGRGGANIKQIMQHTGANIHFPDPAIAQAPRKSTVYVTGPMDSVCLARQHLIGCLPLVLMFDMKEETEIDQGKLSQLMEQLDVFISIKPKPKQPSKSVIVKSIERNAGNLYEARRRLLGEEGETVPVVRSNVLDGLTNNTVNISSLGLFNHNVLKYNASPVLLLNGTRTHLGSLPTVQGATTLPSLVTTPAGTCLYNPNVVLVPQLATVATQPVVRNIQPSTFATNKTQQAPTQLTTLQQNGITQPALPTSAQSVATSVQPSLLNALASMSGTANEQSVATSSTQQSSLRNTLSNAHSPPRVANASTQMAPIDHESRALERERERSMGHREGLYPGPEVLDPGPPPKQVSVSVEARPSIAQLQQQQQLQQLQAAIQRDINQNVHKASHSPAQLSSPSRGRVHSTSTPHPQQHLRTTSTDISPPNSPLTHHPRQPSAFHRPPPQQPPSLNHRHQHHHQPSHNQPGLDQQLNNMLEQLQFQQQQSSQNGLLQQNHQAPPHSQNHEAPPHSLSSQQLGTPLSIEELLRSQQAEINQLQTSLASAAGLGGTPPGLVTDADLTSLAMCTRALSDLINSQPATSSINSQSLGNNQFDLASLMDSASTGVDLSAGLSPGTSILDVLLPKLNIPALNPQATSELFNLQSPGSEPSSPDHPLLRSGSPQLPAHPPDSPLSGIGASGRLEEEPGAPETPPPQQPPPLMRKRSSGLENFSFPNGCGSSLSNHSSDSEGSTQDHMVAGLNQPGAEQAFNLLSGNMLYESIDYEKKKLLATKAMAKKPDGESRTPTDYWSGLGFSKSMPDHAIRDRLRASGVKYKGPTMATTYENENSELAEVEEEDRDPWKGSPYASPSNSFNAGLRQRVQPHTPPSPATPQSPMHSPDYSPKRTVADYGMVRVSSPSVQDPDWLPTTDMAELFSKLGLGKYTYRFQEQEIDMGTFLTLTDQDLKELGITTFGARRKMLLAIDDLNKRQTPISAAPGSNNPFRKTDRQMLPRRLDIASQSGRW